MKPRSGSFMRQLEGAAEAVHNHVHQAANYAGDGDYRRARTAAGRAELAARELKELLGRAAAQDA
jgi:hypothetical protein